MNTAPLRGAASFAVPRHLFIPQQAWSCPLAGGNYWIDKGKDPDTWWKSVYSNTSIVTQIDDGETPLNPDSVKRSDYTCSSSAPSLVFAFLGLLDAYPGDHVLEIGTGTGWTAGLLSNDIGDENVTTIEIDEELAGTASENLKNAGFSPNLIVSDGAEIIAGSGSFDRIHVTCGVHEVPRAWLKQSRPGGSMVFPWMYRLGGGQIAKLTVSDDRTAIGRFHGPCGYMLLRGQRPHPPEGVADDERESTTMADPRSIARPSQGRDICMAAILGNDVAMATANEEDNTFLAILSEGQSHALIHTNGDHVNVKQRGPRNLWDEAENAHRQWVAYGTPGPERFGITVTQKKQYIWLDTPDNPIN